MIYARIVYSGKVDNHSGLEKKSVMGLVMTVYPKIYVFKVGSIPGSFIDLISATLNGFYRSLKFLSLPEFVEVYVYGTSYEKMVFLEAEARDMGVIVIGDFITVHEAWRGWPRIHVDYEKCHSLEPGYVKALLLHEAAHSVLHGSPLYYLVDIDQQLIDSLGFEYAAKTIYLASTVVKDLDVHRFLVEHGYRSYVEKYLEFLVNTQLKDIECSDILGTLQLMKILTPCIFLENKCIDIERNLHEDCRSLVREIIKTLEQFIEIYPHADLSQRTVILAKKIIEVARKYGSVFSKT